MQPWSTDLAFAKDSTSQAFGTADLDIADFSQRSGAVGRWRYSLINGRGARHTGCPAMRSRGIISSREAYVPFTSAWRIAFLTAVIAVEAGCAATRGRVSMEVVPTRELPVAQSTKEVQLKVSDEIVIDAEPKALLVPPKFPPRIHALKEPVVVPMRIVVGVDGTVTNVSLQPGRFSATIPYSSEFESEIRKATRQWLFIPARIIYTKPDGSGGQDYVGERKVEMYFDMDFTFAGPTKTSMQVGKRESAKSQP